MCCPASNTPTETRKWWVRWTRSSWARRRRSMRAGSRRPATGGDPAPGRRPPGQNGGMQRILGTGIWAFQLRYGEADQIADAAAELEELGYSALWIPDVGGDVFGSVERLMASTQRAYVATGILNLWMHSPEESAAHHARL